MEGCLFKLERSYQVLDSSRPWIVYWITHSIAVLGHQDLLKKHAMTIANFMKTCENQTTGGYGGRPGMRFCCLFAETACSNGNQLTV